MVQAQGFQYEEGRMPGSQYAARPAPLGEPPKAVADQSGGQLEKAVSMITPVLVNNAKVKSNIKKTESATTLTEDISALSKEAMAQPPGEQVSFFLEGYEDIYQKGYDNQNTETNRALYDNFALNAKNAALKSLTTHETGLLKTNAEEALESFANSVVAPVIESIAMGSPAETVSGFADLHATWATNLRNEYLSYVTDGEKFGLYGTKQEAINAFEKRMTTDNSDLLSRLVARSETHPSFIPLAREMLKSKFLDNAGSQESKLNSIESKARAGASAGFLTNVKTAVDNASGARVTYSSAGTPLANYSNSPNVIAMVSPETLSRASNMSSGLPKDIISKVEDGLIEYVIGNAGAFEDNADANAVIEAELNGAAFSTYSKTEKRELGESIRKELGDQTEARGVELAGSLNDDFYTAGTITVANLTTTIDNGLHDANFDTDGNKMGRKKAILEATAPLLKDLAVDFTVEGVTQLEELFKYYDAKGVKDETISKARNALAEKLTDAQTSMVNFAADMEGSFQKMTGLQVKSMSSTIEYFADDNNPDETYRDMAIRAKDWFWKNGQVLDVHRNAIEADMDTLLGQENGAEATADYLSERVTGQYWGNWDTVLREIDWQTKRQDGSLDTIINLALDGNHGLAKELGKRIDADQVGQFSAGMAEADILTSKLRPPDESMLHNYLVMKQGSLPDAKSAVSAEYTKIMSMARKEIDKRLGGQEGDPENTFGGPRTNTAARKESVAITFTMMDFVQGNALGGQAIEKMVKTPEFWDKVIEYYEQPKDSIRVGDGSAGKDDYIPKSEFTSLDMNGKPYVMEGTGPSLIKRIATGEYYADYVTAPLTNERVGRVRASKTFFFKPGEDPGNVMEYVAGPDLVFKPEDIYSVMVTPVDTIGKRGQSHDYIGIATLNDGSIVELGKLNKEQEQDEFLLAIDLRNNLGKPNIDNIPNSTWVPK